MIHFFSDLDNTLVYSHRVLLSGERIAVEYLDDRVQSYMTKKTYDFLKNATELNLIPTTARTCEQYSRLAETFSGFGCRYALVCNGGILLDYNRVDSEWLADTIRISGQELGSLNEAINLLQTFFPEQQIHCSNGIMVYFKTDTPVETASQLRSMLNLKNLNIYYDSRKVYCIPSSINKGSAIKRFEKRMGIEWSIAAGDSIPDIPMLQAANAAIIPCELADSIECRHKYIADRKQCYSDYICDVLMTELTFNRNRYDQVIF